MEMPDFGKYASYISAKEPDKCSYIVFQYDYKVYYLNTDKYRDEMFLGGYLPSSHNLIANMLSAIIGVKGWDRHTTDELHSLPFFGTRLKIPFSEVVYWYPNRYVLLRYLGISEIVRNVRLGIYANYSDSEEWHIQRLNYRIIQEFGLDKATPYDLLQKLMRIYDLQIMGYEPNTCVYYQNNYLFTSYTRGYGRSKHV